MALDIWLLKFLNALVGQSAAGDFIILILARYFPYVFALYIIWWFFQKYDFRDGIKAIAAAFVARYAVVESVRYFYPRPRPFLIHEIQNLYPAESGSFPSGHVTFLFALSAAAYRKNKKVGLWFFAISIFHGLTRIMAGIHYPSDILGGIIVGLAVFYIISKIPLPKTST